MKTEVNEYEKQANDFLNKTKTLFRASFSRTGKHFDDDKEIRDVYQITLKRGESVYTFGFGQSLQNSKHFFLKAENFTLPYLMSNIFMHEDDAKRKAEEIKTQIKKKSPSFKPIINVLESKRKAPTAYDVLTCLTKYDPGTFENFCSEFGYDEDSRTAERIYKSVVAEWMEVSNMFNENEIELLSEIQ